MPYPVGAPSGFMTSQPYPSVPMNTSLPISPHPSTFPNMPRTYSVPPNIEHRPIHRNAFDSFMSMEQMTASSYGIQSPMPMPMPPASGFQSSPFLGTMVYGHPNNSGMGTRRPAPDEGVERSTRARRHRTH